MKSPILIRKFVNEKSMVDILNSLQEEGIIENIKNLVLHDSLDIPVIFGLERLKSLETLDCWKCQTYQILNLDKILNLKEIRASANNISNISYFNNCNNLEKLNLNGNKKLEIVDGLFNCNSLKFLELSFCNISKLDLHCYFLEELLLKNNKIREINNINHLRNLKILNLGSSNYTSLIDINIDTLEEFILANSTINDVKVNSKNLKLVNFHYSHFTNDCKLEISNCSVLDVSFSNFNSTVFNQIKFNEKLQLLGYSCIEHNDILFSDIINKFPNILEFELYKTHFIDYSYNPNNESFEIYSIKRKTIDEDFIEIE